MRKCEDVEVVRKTMSQKLTLLWTGGTTRKLSK
jgi:hypothetical protein